MDLTRTFATATTLGLMATLAAACNTSSFASQAGLVIMAAEPAAGATVSLPFDVEIHTSVPLGAPESGLHHVHIWFGDNDTEYLSVRATDAQITDAPPGTQTMHISLRHPDHTPAGADARVPLVINGNQQVPDQPPLQPPDQPPLQPPDQLPGQIPGQPTEQPPLQPPAPDQPPLQPPGPPTDQQAISAITGISPSAVSTVN